MALLVVGADATGNGAVLAQGVAHTEAYHSILVLRTVLQPSKELSDLHEGIAAVEVVAVDDAERLFNNVLAHEHGVVRAPRLHTAFGN